MLVQRGTLQTGDIVVAAPGRPESGMAPAAVESSLSPVESLDTGLTLSRFAAG